MATGATAPARAPAELTVRLWHKRLRGSDKWIEGRGLRFEVRGRKVVLAGHTSSNCDVEVQVDGDTLMALMRAYAAARTRRD